MMEKLDVKEFQTGSFPFKNRGLMGV